MPEKVQRFGGFLAAMVVPNIGAFIAWGLITALFIPNGWAPNPRYAELVGPMIIYLLPILIGYTGGALVYDTRGGVVGAAATMGLVVGAEIPMFLGAMVMGPLGGYLIKRLDRLVEDRTPASSRLSTVTVTPPLIHEQNPTGAGDALVGGLAWGVHEGRTVLDALRWGVACGAATASRPGTEVGTRDGVVALLAEVSVRPTTWSGG